MSEHRDDHHELPVYDLRCGAVSPDASELAIGVFPDIKLVEAGEIGEKLSKLIPAYMGGLALQVGPHLIGRAEPTPTRRLPNIGYPPRYTEFVVSGARGFFEDRQTLENLVLLVARVIEIDTKGVCVSSIDVLDIKGGLSLFEKDIQLLGASVAVQDEQLPAA